MNMRIDKFIAQQLNISRTEALRAIRAKKVVVNGEIIKNSAQHVQITDKIFYDNHELVSIMGFRYYMLNKPVDVVCSTVDLNNQTLFSLIDEPMQTQLHIVGRLDKDTTGLVLLTDDGQWSHRITSPRHHCSKTYYVTLAEPILDAEKLEECFLAGIQLKNEKKLTKPAHLLVKDAYHVQLTISEGRYHQIKRMFAAIGNSVLVLHRQQIGEISLDPCLAVGEYRHLTPAEIAMF